MYTSLHASKNNPPLQTNPPKKIPASLLNPAQKKFHPSFGMAPQSAAGPTDRNYQPQSLRSSPVTVVHDNDANNTLDHLLRTSQRQSTLLPDIITAIDSK